MEHLKSLYLSKKNLLHNLNIIKSKTNAKICAVVKANAYGHGTKEICSLLYGKVDFFSVASLEEALEIRSFDKTTKILVLGNCSNFVLASKNNISITIFSINQLKKLEKKLKDIHNINIHLKLNTGMNRLGFSSINELKKALQILKKINKKVNIEGVFTHFATLRNDIAYFNKQEEVFEIMISALNECKNLLIHGGGSLTSIHSKKYNMLRFGIFLYGYGLKELKPVLSVKAKIIATQKIKKGENVGYSKSFISKKNCTIAVLHIGYFDGVPRSFINENFYYKNQPIKILNVCMDMTIVELPENLNNNISITVFDNASQWAKTLNTNEHDILVNFNSFRGEKIIR